MSRYLRRLAVVCVAIAVVVGLGFLWRISPAAGLITDDHGDRRLPGAAPSAPNPPQENDRHRSRLNGGFDLGSIDEVVQTMVIGGLVLAIVVAVDRSRRRRRPVVPPAA